MSNLAESDLNPLRNITFPISPFKKKPKIRDAVTPSRQSERLSNERLCNSNMSLALRNGESKEVRRRKSNQKCATSVKWDQACLNGVNLIGCQESEKMPSLKNLVKGIVGGRSNSTISDKGSGETDALNLTLMSTKKKLVDRIKRSLLTHGDGSPSQVDVDLSIVKVEMEESDTTCPSAIESTDIGDGLEPIEHFTIKSEMPNALAQVDYPTNVIATYGHFMALPNPQHTSKSEESTDEVGDRDEDTVLMHRLICLMCKRTENVWIKKSCIQGNVFICKTCGKLMENGGMKKTPPSTVECNILEVTCIKCNMTFSNALEVDLHNDSVHRDKPTSAQAPKRSVKPQFCGECNQTFSSGAEVCKHIKQRRHKCQYCEKLFATNSDLKKHVNIHTNEKMYICIYCNKSFNSRGNMVKHLQTHKERHRQFKCEFCNKTFLKSDHLKVHVNTHTNEKLYECPYCKKKFNRKYCLQLHINIHTLEKIYECQLCKKICMDPSTLRKHIATHSDQRPYKCDKCDKTFKQKPHLTTHLKTHSVQETFRCSHCDKLFFTRSTWRAHLNTHTHEKCFYCMYCQKTFATKCNLLTHVNNKHATNHTYKCSFCDKVFTDPSTVRKHENIHTNSLTYQCAYCDKLFLRKTHLRSHINMHIKYKPYKCKQCDKSFAIKSYLKIHYNIHNGVKPYSCKLCGKAFVSQSSVILHTNSHTREKMFQCSHCEKKFTQKANLKSHIFRHHHQQSLLQPPSSIDTLISVS